MTTAQPYLDDLTLNLARRYYPHTFAEWASFGAWKPWRHLVHISKAIAEAVYEGNGRLIVNIEPRLGKSTLISEWVPIWALNNWPAMNIIECTHTAMLATEWGRQCRNQFASNPRLTTRLSPDRKAAGQWNTPEGGGLMTAGVGGSITGFGGNLIVIDDPVKSFEDAWSSMSRRRLVEWFNGTLYDRREPGATIVVVMHRWHVSDLCGYLIDEHSDNWKVIRLPALAEPGDPMGREEGEALCPERYDEPELHSTRKAVGELIWSSKYQQNPDQTGASSVYSSFGADNIRQDLEFRPDLPLQVSFDFNVNPGMHVLMGQEDTIADLFTAIDEIHEPRMSTREAMEALEKWILARWPDLNIPGGEIQIFGDASGSSANIATGETCYQIVRMKLNRMGVKYRVLVPSSNPAIIDRMNSFNEALRDMDGVTHYHISPNCTRLMDDLRNLRTDEFGLIDKTDQKLSHASDAEGYRVHFRRPMLRLEIPRGRYSV